MERRLALGPTKRPRRTIRSKAEDETEEGLGPLERGGAGGVSPRRVGVGWRGGGWFRGAVVEDDAPGVTQGGSTACGAQNDVILVPPNETSANSALDENEGPSRWKSLAWFRTHCN